MAEDAPPPAPPSATPAAREQEILESISDAFYAVDRDWRFTYVNRRAEQYWGRPHGALIGRVYWDEFPEIVGSESYRAHQRAAQTREVERLEAVSRVVGRWLDITIYPAADGGLSVYFRDIEEKKRAERALRESEERLRVIADNVPAMIGYYDRSLRYSWINEEYGRFFGVSADAIRGRTLEEWLAPHVFARLKPALDRALAGERVTVLDCEPDKHGPGRHGWTEETFIPHFDDGGDVVGLFALVMDVSARKNAEEALRRSEAQLRQVTDALPALVSFIDAGLVYRFVNRAYEDYYGRPCEEIVDRPVAELLGPRHFERLRPGFARALAGQETRFEDSVSRDERAGTAPTSGRWRHSEEHYVPRRGPTGEVEGFYALVIDITALKEAEQHQQTLLAELQHRVRNILAVVRSIVRRSDDGGRSAEEYVQHLEGRLSALARTQVLLTRRAGARVDLEEVVRDEILVQAAADRQVTIEGPDVALAPKAAEVLTLAIHELATNSTKYGAFSRASGRASIGWRVEPREGEPWLVLRWVETGVPIVGPAPHRRGFGSELISGRIPYELKGYGTFELKPGGLESEIGFPLGPEGESILGEVGEGA